MTGNIGQPATEFKNFMVTVPEGRRYWDDDTTGLMVKKGKPAEINTRLFRSAELKFALVRNQLLIISGECVFAFKNKMIKIVPGKNKNIIIDLDEVKNEKKSEPIIEVQSKVDVVKTETPAIVKEKTEEIEKEELKPITVGGQNEKVRQYGTK